MNKEQLEAMLSQSMDDGLNPQAQTVLDSALESEEWSDLKNDLSRLKDISAIQAPPPSAALYSSLQEKVNAEYGRPEKRPFWSFIFARPILVSALLLVVFGTFTWRQLNLSQRVEEGDPNDLARLKLNVNAAQQQFHQAILKMETLAIARLEELPPDLAHDYAANLRMINKAIANCEAMLENHGTEYQVYASLSRAYESKVKLLERILEG